MSFNQTRDLLEVARQFHRDLAGLYEQMKERAASTRVRDLIATLIEHEQLLERQLGEYQEGVSANILDTFFQYDVVQQRQCFHEYVMPESLDAMDVIAATRHFDQCLGEFYREMAGKAQSEHVWEVLHNLTHMEQREQMSLSRRTLELVAAC